MNPYLLRRFIGGQKGGGLFVNRETTYRALEDLVKIKIVSKFYDEAKKKIVYCIKDENDP